MTGTPLTIQLAKKISDAIRDGNIEAGARLVERKLADQMKVSRSPIRGALQLLEADGIIGSIESGGYVVIDPSKSLSIDSVDAKNDDEVYQKIAEDRLDGSIPDRVTENVLIKRYNVTPRRLAKILGRISSEGWIERLPGHGWEFLPMLTSIQAYEDSYRYRLTIEPAAILEPSFVLNRDAVLEVRNQQQALIDGDIWNVSNPELFDLNSHFHETIIECSQNLFFIEGLRRVDKLRRLIEYRQSLDRKYAIIRCKEHVHLATLILDGRREEASKFLKWHLSTVSREKVLKVKDDV